MAQRFDQLARALAAGTTRRQTARRLAGIFLPLPPPPLDFDALARDVAQGLSRRDALLRLGGGLLGALFAALGLAGPARATDGCPPGQVFCTGPDRCCPPHWLCCAPHCIPPDYTCCPGPPGSPVQVCPPGQLCVNGSCAASCPANTSPCRGSRGTSCCNVFHQKCCQGQCCDDPQATCCNDGCHPAGTRCCAEGGACPPDQDCCAGGCCAAGQRCAGGTCTGGCAAGQTLCGTSCVDTRTDPQHCGNCTTLCTGNTICSGSQCLCPPSQFCAEQRAGMSGGLCCAATEGCHHNQGAPLCLPAGCPSGTVACQGRCVSPCSGGKVLDPASCLCACPGGLTECSGVCVDLQSDAQHCGSCPKSCASGESCVQGQCRGGCGAGETLCSGRCVNPQTDTGNCGGCGKTCTSGQSCTGGQCTCSSTSQCPAGQVCVNGRCGACTASGQCPAGRSTCCGGVCTNITNTDPNNCGACGRVCPPTVCDASGTVVRNGAVDCVGGMCFYGSFRDCPAGQVCLNGACGACTASSQCPPGRSTCCSGVCTNIQFTDPNNCGACGRVCPPTACDASGTFALSNPDCTGGRCQYTRSVRCPAGRMCVNGTCCPPGLTTCPDACVDTQTDRNHCGGCSNVCVVGNCVNGACV